MPDAAGSQQPKLLDEVRTALRLRCCSIHAERACVNWTVRFVRFHGTRPREGLSPAEPKTEAFLTDLAVRGNAARIMEAVRLRVKDIDYPMKRLTVRSDKGGKDRGASFPAALTPFFQALAETKNHLAGIKATIRKGPPLPPLIFIGKAKIMNPSGGNRSRLATFSRPGMFFSNKI